ncbi:recombinase family protein [Streptomyces sp. NPDC058430]|uniref:recombinase family protein n=1 Tax=Streptomyces sp. NPDC058430 TaxID=3346495 RepID=UPI00365B6150
MTASLVSAAVDGLEPDLPAPTSTEVGYALGVSTAGQLLDRQIAAPTAAGCIRVFADRKGGRNIEREGLWKTRDYLRSGHTLVVASLDRLGEDSKLWRA